MKKLLLVLLVLGSMSTFAEELTCRVLVVSGNVEDLSQVSGGSLPGGKEVKFELENRYGKMSGQRVKIGKQVIDIDFAFTGSKYNGIDKLGLNYKVRKIHKSGKREMLAAGKILTENDKVEDLKQIRLLTKLSKKTQVLISCR